MTTSEEELGPVPWQCWEIHGFKDCNAEAGNITNRTMVEMGAKPGTAIWSEFYPKLLRLEVNKCEISHGCSKESIEEQLRKEKGGSTDSDILARLRAQTGQESPSSFPWIWLALVGAIGVGYFAYKRTR